MSDISRITQSPKADRDAATDPAFRQAKALEELADAAEGIRQDLTVIASMYPKS
jgi:hypothetical protein